MIASEAADGLTARRGDRTVDEPMPALEHDPIRPLFRYCPRCGATGFNKAEPPAMSCDACGFFYFLNPAVAAAAIIRDEGGHVLFIRRAKNPFKSKLSFPGGFIDKGESAEEAVAREVREELGLEIVATRFLVTHPNHYEYKTVPYAVLDLFYFAVVRSLDQLRADPSEVSGHQFLDIAAIDLADVAFDSHRAVIERLRAGE